MKTKRLVKRTGFTLIELLIVVAIIAILAAIAVPNFLEAQTRAKVSRGKMDMRAISTALESYKIDTNNYPPDYQYYQYGGGTISTDCQLYAGPPDDARIFHGFAASQCVQV